MPRLCKGSDLTLFDDVGKKASSSKHKDRKCPCSWNSHLHVIWVSLLSIFVHPPKFSPKNLLKNPNPPKKTQKKHIDTWHLTIWQTIKTHQLDIWPTTYPGLRRNSYTFFQGRVFTSLGTFKSSIASLHTLLFHLRILETICWCDWLFWLWWDSGDVFFGSLSCFLLFW